MIWLLEPLSWFLGVLGASDQPACGHVTEAFATGCIGSNLGCPSARDICPHICLTVDGKGTDPRRTSPLTTTNYFPMMQRLSWLCERLIKGGQYFFDWDVTGEQRSPLQTQVASYRITRLRNNQFLYFQKLSFSFSSTTWCPSAVQPVCRSFGLFGLHIVWLSSPSRWCSDIILVGNIWIVSMFFFPGLHASRATNNKTARSFCTTWWTRYEWRKQKYVHDTRRPEVLFNRL